MELKKGYGSDVHHKICGYQLHTFLEHKILGQKVFLKSSERLLGGNWALSRSKKFQVYLETQH